MYLSYYNLREKPFQISTNPKFLWLGPKHREALAILQYGILTDKSFLLLTGSVGTGKTTLINMMLNELDTNIVVAIVSNPSLQVLDFFNFIADAFSMNKKFTSKGDFIIHFKQFLNDLFSQNKKALLIIDEVQILTKELLEDIKLLSNFEKQGSKLLNIFLVGQNEFNEILTHKENIALRQRITVHYNIKPLTKKEIETYVDCRLKIAGAEKNMFSKGAMNEVFKFSQGIPRLINVICNRALLTGYVKEMRTISKKIVQECSKELEILPFGKKNKTRKTLWKIVAYAAVILLLIVVGYLCY